MSKLSRESDHGQHTVKYHGDFASALYQYHQNLTNKLQSGNNIEPVSFVN